MLICDVVLENLKLDETKVSPTPPEVSKVNEPSLSIYGSGVSADMGTAVAFACGKSWAGSIVNVSDSLAANAGTVARIVIAATARNKKLF